MSDRENLQRNIDEALQPLVPNGAWYNKAMETGQATRSTGNYLKRYGLEIKEAGRMAVELLSTTFPRTAGKANQEATEIIEKSHQRLTELLSDTDAETARSGLEKIGAAALASREISGAIDSGAQILAHRLREKIGEVVELINEIGDRQVFTPLLDTVGLEQIAEGDRGSLPVFRAVAEQLEGGIEDIRGFQSNL